MFRVKFISSNKINIPAAAGLSAAKGDQRYGENEKYFKNLTIPFCRSPVWQRFMKFTIYIRAISTKLPYIRSTILRQ